MTAGPYYLARRPAIWLLSASLAATGLLDDGLIHAGQSVAEPESDSTAANGEIDFRRDIFPLLKAHCFDCHAGVDADSGVRLDLRSKLLGETDGRPLVKSGKSGESILIRLVAGLDPGQRMPPEDSGDPLSSEQVGLLRDWVDQGVDWDDGLLPPIERSAGDSHWAFRAINRPLVPQTAGAEWARSPIDAFIVAQQEAAGLRPTDGADARTLIRRLYLNLLGIPPTPEEVSSHLSDQRPGAYERLVERLLASPHYGERWGRHWLDVARFAESQGYGQNLDWPHIWRYRDYVVDSFNGDRPFSDFARQQVAGDEITPFAAENIVATGFLSTARVSADDADNIRQRNDMYVDVVNATASAFLGLTMGCAQCHDHKFDPITQRDYYRFQAFFTRGLPGNLIMRDPKARGDLEAAADELRDLSIAVRERILHEAYAEEPDDVRRVMQMPDGERTPEEESLFRATRSRLNIRLAGCNGFRIEPEEKSKLDALTARLAELSAAADQTWGFYSPVTSPHALGVLPMQGNFPLIHNVAELRSAPAYLFVRGDPYAPAMEVEPGWPEVFGTPESTVGSEKPRTALADWLTSAENPLTARVWVNRIWHYHFGRGLVSTPGNFGMRGEAPSHPELLDWLAAELIDSGWSTKHIQRLIVTSAAYRQSSVGDARYAQIDPDDRLLWRWPRHRTEAEVVRDAMLVAAGMMDASLGGPSVPAGQASPRRSMYLFQKRDNPPEMQSLFDGPTSMSASCDERHVSTSPLQPLFLLNNESALRAAESLAERIARTVGDDASSQVRLAFDHALGRPPDEFELRASLEYLESPTRYVPVADESAVPKIVRVSVPKDSQVATVLNSDEVWDVGTPNAPFDPARGAGQIVAAASPATYTLHNTSPGTTAYSDYAPDPDKASVSYQFDRPTVVAEVEMIVHNNGVLRIEGFVGDHPDRMESIGDAVAPNAARGQQYVERSSQVFAFDPSRVREGSCFRFIVRETVQESGYANYQSFPRGADHERIAVSDWRAVAEPVGRGLSLWLRADADVLSPDGSPAVDATPVATWRDQLFGDNAQPDDAMQAADHQRPLFKDAPDDGIDGRPVVRFAGGEFGVADHFLHAPDSSELRVTDGYTLFAVVRFRGNGQGNGIVLEKSRNGGDDIGAYALLRYGESRLPVAANNIAGAWGDQIVGSKPAADGVACLMVAQYDGEKIRLEVFDQAGLLSSDETPLCGQIDPGQDGALGIGGYCDAFSELGERLNGDIAEVLIYRTALAENEQKAVIEYLRGRYGVGDVGVSRLTMLCHALLNLNEFVYID